MLKNGDQKQRRNLIMCDESNMTIVVCFWSEKNLAELEALDRKVLAIVGARVSDYSGKSINVGEDCRLFPEPRTLERTA
jgi:hypothetical protein